MTSHERAAEVDTKLADIWGQTGQAMQDIEGSILSLRSGLGQRRPYGRTHWEVSVEDTEAAARVAIATPDLSGTMWFATPSVRDGAPYLTYHGQQVERSLARLDASRARIVALRAEARPLQDEYGRDPWPRFFLVQNTGGHIHTSMSCKTTFPTTQWAWLPELSGLTEEDAVAAHGPRLCSICYPSAPVEWTLGLPKAPRCPGSNERPAPGYERYASQPCSVCGRHQPVSRNTGVVRAHKPKEA